MLPPFLSMSYSISTNFPTGMIFHLLPSKFVAYKFVKTKVLKDATDYSEIPTCASFMLGNTMECNNITFCKTTLGINILCKIVSSANAVVVRINLIIRLCSWNNDKMHISWCRSLCWICLYKRSIVGLSLFRRVSPVDKGRRKYHRSPGRDFQFPLSLVTIDCRYFTLVLREFSTPTYPRDTYLVSCETYIDHSFPVKTILMK